MRTGSSGDQRGRARAAEKGPRAISTSGRGEDRELPDRELAERSRCGCRLHGSRGRERLADAGSSRCDPRGDILVVRIHDTDTFDLAIGILRKLLETGADVGAVDSYGNTPAQRFALDLAQIWGPQVPEAKRTTTRARLEQVREQLIRSASTSHLRHPATGPARHSRDFGRPEVTPTRPKTKFAVGDRITHPQFGDGRVLRSLPDGKIEVDFAVGHRVLVHGR